MCWARGSRTQEILPSPTSSPPSRAAVYGTSSAIRCESCTSATHSTPPRCLKAYRQQFEKIFKKVTADLKAECRSRTPTALLTLGDLMAGGEHTSDKVATNNHIKACESNSGHLGAAAQQVVRGLGGARGGGTGGASERCTWSGVPHEVDGGERRTGAPAVGGHYRPVQRSAPRCSRRF